jgi:hypothetical protein
MVAAYREAHPEFRAVGESMLAAWESGVSDLAGRSSNQT